MVASTTAFKPADKPYFIYVADPEASAAAGFDTVTKVVLDDDRVKLGAKAFHAVKMTAADAKSDPVLAEKGGKELPRVIFVSNDLKSVKAFEGGSLSATVAVGHLRGHGVGVGALREWSRLSTQSEGHHVPSQ